MSIKGTFNKESKISQLIHQGPAFNVVKLDIPGAPYQPEAVDHVPCVVILPCLGNKQVLAIRQKRFIVDHEPLLELPAGFVDSGETPEEAALRETEEECGYKAGKLEHLIGYYSSPGCCNEWIDCYLASDLVKTQTNFDQGEDIETIVMPFNELFVKALKGEVKSGPPLVTILYAMALNSSV